jgi:hypothetical protein
MPMRSRFSVALFALFAAAGSALAGACSNQGEGEPCNPYSSDCQSQYECIVIANNGYRCCPIPPAQPEWNSICVPSNTGVNDADILPLDAGAAASDAPAADAPAATEAGPSSEASVDAPPTSTDAPGE